MDAAKTLDADVKSLYPQGVKTEEVRLVVVFKDMSGDEPQTKCLVFQKTSKKERFIMNGDEFDRIGLPLLLRGFYYLFTAKDEWTTEIHLVLPLGFICSSGCDHKSITLREGCHDHDHDCEDDDDDLYPASADYLIERVQDFLDTKW